MGLLGKVIGGAATAVGQAQDYLTPGKGSGTLTDVGRAIYSPNSTLSNPGAINPFSKGSAFTYNAPAASSGGSKSQGGGGGGSAAVQQQQGSIYTGSSSGGSSASNAAARAAAQQQAANTAAYQDQINALNQLLQASDNSLKQGRGNIDQSYNNNLSRLNQSQSNTLQAYNTQRADTQSEYSRNLQRINQNARNGYNNLQLLLGGTGSAGNVLAPAAVSSAANEQRGNSSDAFARNNRDLDTAVSRANQAYDNNKNDLFNQKQSKLQELLNNVNSQKQNYLSQRDAAQNQLNIARGGGYTAGISNGEIQRLLGEQGNLSRLFPTTSFNVQDVKADPVSLAQYEAEAARQAMGGGAVDPGTDTTAASLAALLREQDDQQSGYAY